VHSSLMAFDMDSTECTVASWHLIWTVQSAQ